MEFGHADSIFPLIIGIGNFRVDHETKRFLLKTA
jgi:hypothetical protein